MSTGGIASNLAGSAVILRMDWSDGIPGEQNNNHYIFYSSSVLLYIYTCTREWDSHFPQAQHILNNFATHA